MNKAHNTIINNIGIPIQSNKFKINGHTIHYIKAGSGTPVVLVHGVNIGWGQWYKNIKALSKAFTVYAIDLPGSGKSSSIDFLHADLYRDFIDVLGKFVTIIVKKEPHIIAHSIGAWVVLKAYLNKQVFPKSLILVNPVGFTTHMPWNQRLLAIPFFAKFIASNPMYPSKKNLAAFFEGVMYDLEKIDNIFVDYVHESINESIVRHPLLLISRLAGLTKVKDEFNLIHDIKNISVKTLTILGQHDPLVPHDVATENIKLNKYINVELMRNSGHVPFIEQSTLFNKKIISFIRKIELVSR